MRRAPATSPARAEGSAAHRAAFTIIELLVAVAIVGVLVSITGTNYLAYVDKARVARAIADIKNLSTAINGLTADGSPLPDSLSDVDDVPDSDPWGNPYGYLKIAGAAAPSKKGKGPSPRKDRFLVPLNTDYDLYSIGADGYTDTNLSSPDCADDIVRANNGGYIGLGDHY